MPTSCEVTVYLFSKLAYNPRGLCWGKDMSVTVKKFRDALPKSLRKHMTRSQIEAVLGYRFIEISSVNGCKLKDIQKAVPSLRKIGIIAHPYSEGPSGRLVSVAFLKR